MTVSSILKWPISIDSALCETDLFLSVFLCYLIVRRGSSQNAFTLFRHVCSIVVGNLNKYRRSAAGLRNLSKDPKEAVIVNEN